MAAGAGHEQAQENLRVYQDGKPEAADAEDGQREGIERENTGSKETTPSNGQKKKRRQKTKKAVKR